MGGRVPASYPGEGDGEPFPPRLAASAKSGWVARVMVNRQDGQRTALDHELHGVREAAKQGSANVSKDDWIGARVGLYCPQGFVEGRQQFIAEAGALSVIPGGGIREVRSDLGEVRTSHPRWRAISVRSSSLVSLAPGCAA